MNIFIESDSSFYEYLVLHRKDREDNERNKEKLLEAQREKEYEEYYYDNINKSNSIFQLPGMNIIDFTHEKVKFSFTPRQVVDLISKTVIFYCTIRYINKRWMIMRNTIPVNIRPIIYSRFLEYNVNIVKLNHIVTTVQFVYDVLVNWSKNYKNFKKQKYERYLRNPDSVFLDSEDEELFLTQEEVTQRRRKLEEIWKRMLPPKILTTSTRKRRA